MELFQKDPIKFTWVSFFCAYIHKKTFCPWQSPCLVLCAYLRHNRTNQQSIVRLNPWLVTHSCTLHYSPVFQRWQSWGEVGLLGAHAPPFWVQNWQKVAFLSRIYHGLGSGSPHCMMRSAIPALFVCISNAQWWTALIGEMSILQRKHR